MGYTALYFACDGWDLKLEKCSVVKLLVARQVNVEARDAKGNTPLLIAAATGSQGVCDALLEFGADKYVQNDNGHGVWQKAFQCSPSLAPHLARLGCPKTWSAKSGRTREGIGQGRLNRHAMTTSAHSRYTSNSAAKSFRKGRHGKK